MRGRGRLSPMSPHVRRTVALCGALALAACERKAPPNAAPDSVSGSTASIALPPPAAEPRTSGWNADAGRALLIHGDGGQVLVVVPGTPGDSSTDHSAGAIDGVLPTEVALFNRAGPVGHARADLVAPGDAGECVRWPTAHLAAVTAGDAAAAWTVGFVGGVATPLGLDSLESATQVDSAGLAAGVTRLASGLPDDTVRALRGVPFSVRSARRFALPGGGQGVVAVLTRALNEEASPIGEQILIVGERPASGGPSPSGAWHLAYHERVSGREDEIAATEVLAAVTLGASQRPTLVLARALSAGNRYSLLERTGERAWRVRWSSVVGGC